MRLLFVSTGRDRAGGAHSFVELAKAMTEHGHEVEALVDQDSVSGQTATLFPRGKRLRKVGSVICNGVSRDDQENKAAQAFA